MARKHLSDLYRRGIDWTVEDEFTGDSVEVYIKKLNPLETKEAREKGNAARARVLMRRNDRESEEWLNAYSEVFDMSVETRVDKCITLEAMQKRAQVEAELAMADDSEWAKDDYLEGLREAWEDLKNIFVDPEIPDDEKKEAQGVYDELNRFADEVDKVVEIELKALRQPFEHLGEEALIEKAVAAVFEETAYLAWMEKYYYYRTFFSTREREDHKKKTFSSVREVEELEPEVYQQLVKGYKEVELNDLEVKDLEQTPTS